MVETAPWPIPNDMNVIRIRREHKPTLTHAEYEDECKLQDSCESNTDSSGESDDEDVALHKAARKKVVRQMNNCGSDLPTFSHLFDSWESRSEKLLHYDLESVMWKAITRNHISIVLYMLQGGYPISAWQVIHTAKLHRFELLEMILDGGWWDINQMQKTLWPSILSSVVRDEVCVQWLLDHGADPNARCAINLTALSDAVRFGSLSTIQLMLDRGGDVTKGELLHHALYRDDKVIETARLLLDRGAPIDRNMYEDDEEGYRWYAILSQTPLHYAASVGMVDIVKLLIERGADVNKLDGKGATRRYGERYTALEHAARSKSWDAYAILDPAYKINVSLE